MLREIDMPTTLKEKNAKHVWTFFAINSVLFYTLSLLPKFDITEFTWQELIYGQGIWVVVTPLILFVINGVFNSNTKASICFWKIKNPLPGSQAFSKYLYQDSRINVEVLKKEYNPLPDGPKNENSLWYKIFKKHEGDPTISRSHRDFLLGRDLCAISFLFMIGAVLGIAFLMPPVTKWFYLGFAIVQYLIIVLISQNYGKRFVCNVLSLESTKL